jgi:hypothetical protein
MEWRMSNENLLSQGQLLFYQTEDGRQRIEVRLQDGSVWLTQKLLAELFSVGVNTINYHIKEIYKDGELQLGATIRKYRIVQKEGSRQIIREVDFYDLNMILAIGLWDLQPGPAPTGAKNSRNRMLK